MKKLLKSLFPRGKKKFLSIGQHFLSKKITEVNDFDYRRTFSISEDSSLVVFSFMVHGLLFLYLYGQEKKIRNNPQSAG